MTIAEERSDGRATQAAQGEEQQITALRVRRYVKRRLLDVVPTSPDRALTIAAIVGRTEMTPYAVRENCEALLTPRPLRYRR